MKNIRGKVHRNLIVIDPKIFIDWSVKLNGEEPFSIKATSTKKYWWKCHKKRCGHVWKDTAYGRVVAGRGCPKCELRAKNRKRIDKFNINKTVFEIEKITKEIDELFELKDVTKTKVLKTYAIIRRKLLKIKQLNFKLRKYEISKKRENGFTEL